MSVRKREWTTSKGEAKQAWVVDYVDQHGKRRLKTFKRKKEADVFESTTHIEVREGTHVADSATVDVASAGAEWLKSCEAAGLERSTLDQYRQHLRLHIVPLIGRMLLSKLSVPAVRAFEDRLRTKGRSPTMVKIVLGSLGALLADAQERNLVVRNAVREIRRGRRRGRDRHAEGRRKGRLRVGVDIPTTDEVKRILGQAKGQWRPFIVTAIFTGLRASELRGLRWSDVDLDARELHVRQRADRFNKIGAPKTEAGHRSVPLPPMVVNTLREWKLACPKGKLDLVFPNGNGNIEYHSNIITRGFIPTLVAAGVTAPTLNAAGEAVTDDDGVVVLGAKYTGLHALRHFYASWCINRRADGGLELPPKMVQERLGHSSITMTMDVYGHLFPRVDDANELAAAELRLMA